MARFIEIVGKVLGGLMALVVGAYVVINGVLLVMAQVKRGDVGGRLTDKLATAVPAATRHQDAVSSALGSAPQHAWIVQLCDFPTSDSGWMVSSYNQECSLQSAVAYAVESPDALARRLTDDLAGAPVEDIDKEGACRTLRASGRPFSGDVRLTTIAITNQTGAESSCARLSSTAQQRLISGAKTPLDENTDWLVVLREEPLDRTDIGCLRWSVLFCDNPFFGKPAWGDLPTT